MANWLVYALAALVLLNGVASIAILRSEGPNVTQKLLQTALVWIVPIVGAVLTLSFSASDGLSGHSSSSTLALSHPGDETTLAPGPSPCGCAGTGGGDD